VDVSVGKHVHMPHAEVGLLLIIGSIFTSGYPWSDPIRLNDFSLALSLIGFFIYGLPGTIVFANGCGCKSCVEARMSQWLPFSMRWPNEKIYLVGVIISENCNKMGKKSR
jgi:hypothetical protein